MGIIRKTKSVKAVLETFEQSNNAISVVDLVKQFHQKMNKTTVYRILEKLEEDGLLHSFIGKDGLKWYSKCRAECTPESHSDTHPHFQCRDCGKVKCLNFEVPIPSLDNYQIDSAELLLIGQCEDCS